MHAQEISKPKATIKTPFSNRCYQSPTHQMKKILVLLHGGGPASRWIERRHHVNKCSSGKKDNCVCIPELTTQWDRPHLLIASQPSVPRRAEARMAPRWSAGLNTFLSGQPASTVQSWLSLEGAPRRQESYHLPLPLFAQRPARREAGEASEKASEKGGRHR